MAGLSMSIQVNERDLSKLTDKLAALASFPGTANQIMKHEAEQAVGRMKRDAPFKTGLLRSEIEIVSQDASDIVIESEAIDPKTGVDYAPVREFGLDGFAPTPYFRHNIDLLENKLEERLERKLVEIARKNSYNIPYTDPVGSINITDLKRKLTKYLKT